MTRKRVDYLYDLRDSAYDAQAILEHCQAQGRVPVVAFHPRRATRKPSQVPKAIPPKPMPEMDWAKRERYAQRTMVERVNARLKDEFGGRHIRVRGGVKVMAHLMFGLIAITADQLPRQLSWINHSKRTATKEPRNAGLAEARPQAARKRAQGPGNTA